MAVITSQATGIFADGSTWVGGVAPTTGDTVVIANGHTVTVAADTPVLGSNASAVGHGVTVQSGGILLVGATLNANGYDTTSNRAVQVDAGGTMQRGTGGNIVVTPVSAWQTIINNDGDFIWDGGTIESGEPWTFVERGQTLVSIAPPKIAAYEDALIWMVPLGGTGATNSTTAGPVSNAAGTAVGTPLDNSFVVTSVVGGSLTPSLVFQNAVSSFDALASTGDYYVDCKNGVVYYYDTESKNRLSITYTVKTHQWLGFGFHSARNGPSKCLIDGATFRRMGGPWPNRDSEFTQQAVYYRYRHNPVVTPANAGYLRNCTFEYCTTIQVYTTTNTVDNKFDLTGNSHIGAPRLGGVWGKGCMLFGFASHVDTTGTFFDCVQMPMNNATRGITGLIANSYTGRCCVGGVFAAGVVGSYTENCVLDDTGSWQDAGGFQVSGTAAGGPNVYRGNKLRFGNRCGRIGSYMVVEDNEFVQHQHHGFVAPGGNGFYTGIKIKNNIIRDVRPTGDMGGGWTLGYNYTHWLDDVEIEGNTFDTGNRSIMFNDREGTKVLGTRLKIWNNNLTNAHQGITQPTADASNQTKKQILRLDYNNEFGMTNAGNVNQGSPVKSSVEYNLDVTRNIPGVALFNPSALNETGKALSLVVSGTPGVDFSMLLSWGGGTAVELVSAQGTATGGTGATSHSVPGTIIDSSKSWTTDEVRLDQGKIVSGTGSGQHFMVRTNNATTLTVMPNVEAGTFTSPATDSVYIVLKSDVQLSDGTQTVEAGLYIPEVPLAAGTYTDTGITFESNALAVDPQYVSATDLTPTNLMLLTAGFDGGYIGALEPQSGDDTAPVLTSPTATATGPTTATASVTTDDGNGTMYFLASTNATENAATVKAALSQPVTADGAQSISLSALDPETAYYVHFVQINGASLESASVVSTAAFTTDAIAVKGATITLYAWTTPQASLADIVALWWDATTPSGAPDYSTTTASTDASGVLTLDLDATTALSIGDSGFLLLYKLDATDHRDSLVFAGRVAVSDIA